MIKVVTHPFGYKYRIQCTNCKSVLEFFLADEEISFKEISFKDEDRTFTEDYYYIICPVCSGTIVTRYADGEDFRIPDKK